MKAYARPDHRCLIDTIDEATGLTRINQETFEELRQRFPDAILVDVDQWCEEKQLAQLAPITWKETDKETYWEMLECVPPAHGWRRFLVGEPMDHLAATGESTFEMYRKRGPKYYVASRPVTIAEFNELIGTK